MIKVYEYTRQPPYWIVRDEEGYWLVPARSDGWAERTPYVGRTSALREIVPPPVLNGTPGNEEGSNPQGA